MIEHLKKIISSDLIINDKPYSIQDNFQYPWQWIANIDTFFKDIESSFSEIISASVNCVVVALYIFSSINCSNSSRLIVIVT